MINPRPTDVLENLLATIDDRILPHVSDTGVLSAATTTRHMLCYVLNQLRVEPESFAAELPRLATLLDQVRDFLQQVGADPALQDLNAARAAADAAPGFGHEADAARIASLREGLHGALSHLIAHRSQWSDKPGYLELRDAIREYLVWQNIEEAKIVGPTFYGKGARR